MTEQTTTTAEDIAAAEAAQAKADAEAAAAKAAAEAQAKAPKGKEAKAKMASAAELRAAIAQVEAGNNGNQRAALVEAMIEAGAKISYKADAVQMDWLGVKMQTTAGLTIALSTWCSKARRAILNGEAV
jgi:CHASE1-domain containing sensor protein